MFLAFFIFFLGDGDESLSSSCICKFDVPGVGKESLKEHVGSLSSDFFNGFGRSVDKVFSSLSNEFAWPWLGL